MQLDDDVKKIFIEHGMKLFKLGRIKFETRLNQDPSFAEEFILKTITDILINYLCTKYLFNDTHNSKEL